MGSGSIVVVVGGAAVAIVVVGFVFVFTRWRRATGSVAGLNATLTVTRRLLDGLPDAVLGLDVDGSIVAANARAATLTGRTEEELVGRSFIGFVSDQDRDDITDRWRRLRIDPTHTGRVVFDLAARDGSSTLVEATMHAAPGDDDRTVLTLRDLGDRDSSTDALEQARRRFRQAFHSAPSGMALVRTTDNRIIDANETLAHMLDRPHGWLLGRSISEITHPDDLRAAAAERARVDLGIDDGYIVEQRYVRSDGGFVWARTRVAVTEEDGVPLAITHIEDITEQRDTAERLAHAASHDPLTELPNRTAMISRLDELLAVADVDEVAVLFIDLDDFKAVNDTLGHGVGDRLLRLASRRLRSVMRDGDRLGRFGGDEFVVLVDGTAGNDDGTRSGRWRADRVALRLSEAMRDPVLIDGHEVRVRASIGSALNTTPGMSADDLLGAADDAMYRDKPGRRRRVERSGREPNGDGAVQRRDAVGRARGLVTDSSAPSQPSSDSTR